MFRLATIAVLVLAVVPGAGDAQTLRADRVDLHGFGGWSYGRTNVNRFLRLGIEAVAEGVESGSQRKILSGLGFGKMQGFLFGKAVPADEFLALLRAGGRLAVPTGT